MDYINVNHTFLLPSLYKVSTVIIISVLERSCLKVLEYRYIARDKKTLVLEHITSKYISLKILIIKIIKIKPVDLNIFTYSPV